MSRRSIIKKYQVLTSADSTTSPNSTQTDVSGIDLITYQLKLDPLVVADLVVSFSNDEVFNQSNITALNFSQTTSLIGSVETEYLVHIENQGFKWLQVQVVDNGGSGNVNAWIIGAGRGA